MVQTQNRVVVVSNVFGDVNRGGAAITAQTLRMVLTVATDVVGIGIGADVDPPKTHRHTRERFPNIPILESPIRVPAGRFEGLRSFMKSIRYLANPSPRRSPASLTWLRHASLVVSKGGHVYVERPSLRSVLSLWSTAFPVIFAQRVGIPTMTSPTSVGPFHSRTSRLVNRFILSRMAFVVVRDPISRRHAMELGLRETQVIQLPDIAFSMAPPTAEKVQRMCSGLGVEPGRFVAMTVRLLAGGGGDMARLQSALVRSVHAVLRHADVDRVLLIDQAGDGAASAAVAQDTGGAVSVVSADLSPEDLVAVYGGARLTIACRLHSAIFSLVGGTKTVVVSLDGKKSEGVFASLGLPGDWVVTMQPHDLERLPHLVEHLLDDDRWGRDVLRLRISRASTALEALPAIMEAAISGSPWRATASSVQAHDE